MRRFNGLFTAVFGPGGLALLVALVALGFGSRSILVDGVPEVGRLAPLPEDPASLVASWWTGWRPGGAGTELVGPDGLALLGLLAGWWPGSPDSLWTVVVLGAVAVGALGTWRLVRPVGGGRSRAIAVLVYLAVPLPYEAIREGSLGTLTAYAVVPWLVRRLVGAHGVAPYGRTGGDPGPGTRRRSLWSDVVVTGLVLAAAVALDPLLIVPALLIGVGLAAGTVTTGVAGLVRLGVVVAGGAGMAAVVHLPLMVDLLGDRTLASLGHETPGFPGIAGTDVGSFGIRDLLALEVGAIGWPAAAALFVPPVVTLLMVSGRHLAVAGRAWFVLVTGAVGLVAVDRGWLAGPEGVLRVVEPEVFLVVVAVGLAWASAAGVAGLGEGLRHLEATSIGRPGRVLSAVVMAIVGAALAVGVAPVAIGSFDGRWGASRTDLMSALPDIGSPMVDGEQRLGGDARILWIGGADVLPVAGLTLEEVQGGSGEGTVVALTDGRPTLIDQWSPGATEGMDEVRTAVRRALVGETHRLGAEVGRWSVARIVLVERSAPIPEPAVDRPVDDRIHAALARQLDLERVGAVNGAATVYRNTEVEAPFSVVRDGNRRVVPASVRRDALGSRTVGIQVDGALRWMHGPDRRWQVSVDGRRVPVLAPGTPTGVDDRPSIRVAAGSEARFELDEGPIRGRRRFQVAAAVGLLLLASWARTARRSHVGEGSW